MNKYQSDICHEASEALRKTTKLMKEAEFGLFQVEGGESLHVFYQTAQTMINELQQSYYVKSKEEY